MTATNTLPTTRIGRGGWIRVLLPELEAPVIYLRFQAAANGALELHDVFLESGEGPLPFDALRRLPLERLVVWANSPQISPEITSRLPDPRPDPALDLAWFQLDVHDEAQRKKVAGTWVEASRLAQAGEEQQAERPWDQEIEQREKGKAVQEPLVIPTTRPFPDSFYADVARRYKDATVHTSKPVTAIAKAHDVKVSTVQSWVGKARDRGYLESHGQGRIA